MRDRMIIVSSSCPGSSLFQQRWAGAPALGIQSGLLFEAWSPTLDPERQSALMG